MNQQNSLNSYLEFADKMMLVINWALFAYSLALASWYNTWAESIVIGGGTVAALSLLYSMVRGELICRTAMALGFMVMSALHIHQAHGMIEFHFGIFALLAMLLYYRDWIPVIAAAAAIAVHHISFYFMQSSGMNIWVLTSENISFWVILLHAGYVVAETVLLVWFSIILKKEATQSTQLMATTDAILSSGKIDLTQRVEESTDLLRRFNSYTQDVEELAKEVQRAAIQLDIEGQSLSKITKQMKANSLEQQHETDHIVASAEQMSTAITEVASNAEFTAGATEKMKANAEKATEVSHETRKAVENLAENIGEAVQTMESLNEQSNNIGTVLDVIRGVAEQTNLLALNAAIEAARAGEQGRGFAVVADEVRTLAQRTQQSTAEIDQIIEALQSDSKRAVKVIEISRDNANGCVVNTVTSLELMQDVSETMLKINSMNAQIATSANQQSTVVNEISQNLSNILSVSKRAAEDASRADESAISLDTASKRLASVVQKFKVG